MGGSMLATRRGDTLPFATDRLKAEFAQVGGDDERSTRRPFPVSVPLLSVLALQTVLALRLMWSKTGFNDEALYLWAGHLELAHILHGMPVPAFQTYFSGAPVIYPPLGALADNLGGLAGARALSLAFMLGATVLLYGTTRRLFGRRAGEIAAGSFGLLGSAQFLGAFATYDPMALFLLALATWLVVMSRGWSSEPLIITAGLVPALADATKYSPTLWDPVVIALAAPTATRGGWLRRGVRAVRLALYTSGAILLFVLLKPYLELKNERYLLGGVLDTQMIYTEHINVTWYQYVDDNYIKYPIPGRGGDSHWQATGLACTRLGPNCIYLEGIAGYQAAIRAHWFTLISMAGSRGTLQDAEIEQAVERSPGYVLLTTVGGAPTWIYAPAYQSILRHQNV
jgi:hypothetical protein